MSKDETISRIEKIINPANLQEFIFICPTCGTEFITCNENVQTGWVVTKVSMCPDGEQKHYNYRNYVKCPFCSTPITVDKAIRKEHN